MNPLQVVITAVLATLATLVLGIVVAWSLWPKTAEASVALAAHSTAWHAGESEFEGRTRCNDYSIGIELEGTDDTPFRTVQYWKLALLIHAIREAYPSMADCPVVGHSDIAPGRKTDPGTEFEWTRLQRLLSALSGQSV